MSATKVVSQVRSVPQKWSVQESHLDLIQANTFRGILLHDSFEKSDGGVPIRFLVHLPWSPTVSGDFIGAHGIHNTPIVLANQPVERKFALIRGVKRNPTKKKAVE